MITSKNINEFRNRETVWNTIQYKLISKQTQYFYKLNTMQLG